MFVMWAVLFNFSLLAQVGPGQSLVFDQAGSRVTIGAQALPPPWTVELWVKHQNSPAVSAPLFIDESGALKLEQFGQGHRVGFTRFGVADHVFDYVAPTNQWVHLAIAANAAETCLFVNGAFHSCVPVRFDLPLAYFGSTPGSTNEQLRAEVDEIRVWGTELLEVRSMPTRQGRAVEEEFWSAAPPKGMEHTLLRAESPRSVQAGTGSWPVSRSERNKELPMSRQVGRALRSAPAVRTTSLATERVCANISQNFIGGGRRSARPSVPGR